LGHIYHANYFYWQVIDFIYVIDFFGAKGLDTPSLPEKRRNIFLFLRSPWHGAHHAPAVALTCKAFGIEGEARAEMDRFGY
jgi:hypothetical protein